MKLILDEVIALQSILEDIGKRLVENDVNAIKDAMECAKDISYVYTTFIGDIPELASMGVEIPTDILTGQLKNFLEGIKYKDFFMLIDCVNFELLDTISLYREILEQLV